MPFDQRAGYPEGEIHGPAAVVPDEIERRHRRLPRASNGVQRARDGDVIDVVPGAEPVSCWNGWKTASRGSIAA